MKLFLDFDEVLADSIQAVLHVLNKKYNKNIQFNEVKTWNFTDVFPETNSEEISQAFDTDEFWDVVKLKNGAKEFMDYVLSNPWIESVKIVSVGRKNNLNKKDKFIKSIWGNKVEFIKVYSQSCERDKSHINMSNGIFIDDNEKNLFTSNAEIKILFKNIENTEWNSKWDGDYVGNFNDLEFYVRLLSFMYYDRYENAKQK